MSFMENNCVASEHLPEKCQGKFSTEGREIVFKYPEYGQYSESTESVPMCNFHYNWLKTLWPMQMSGETLCDALENDLLARFKRRQIFRVWRHYFKQYPKGDGTLYLLEGHEDDDIPLKGDKHIWQLEGVFLYDDYRNSSIFEIVPVTNPGVMKWLSENKLIYLYPAKTIYEWISEETGEIVPEEEIDQVDGRCSYEKVENTQEYTNISRDFEMFGCEQDIKDHFRRNHEKIEATKLRKCLYFMCDELRDPEIFDWNSVYGDCLVEMGDVYLLKEALVNGNQKTISRYRHAYPDKIINFHAIIWTVYVATNHELYWNTSFGSTPDFYEEEKRYNRFWKNVVELFVEEGLAKPLLCLAISGERNRDVGTQSERNIMHPNSTVVKMLIPEYIHTHDEITDGLTAWQYWNCYDNRLFKNGDHTNDYHDDEVFRKSDLIGEFLSPGPEQEELNEESDKIDGMETEEIQEEKKATNQEQVFQDIMNIYGVGRKGAEEKLDELVKNVVVKRD